MPILIFLLALLLPHTSWCKSRMMAVEPNEIEVVPEPINEYWQIELSDNSKNTIRNINNQYSGDELKRTEELNKYSKKFALEMADKNIIQKKFNQIKKENPAIQKMSDEVSEATKVEASNEWFKFGTDADLINGQAKIWLEQPLFNTQAQLEGDGCNLMVYHSFDSDELPSVKTSLFYNPQNELISRVNTRLMVFDVMAQKLLNKNQEFQMLLNYGINF